MQLDDEDIKVIIEGEDDEDSGKGASNATDDQSADDDKSANKTKQDQNDDNDADEDGSDQDGDDSDDDEENARGALHERRRAERKARKIRRAAERQELIQLRQTVANLQGTVAKLSGKSEEDAISRYDNGIRGATAALEKAKSDLAKAIDSGDGATAAKCQEDISDAKMAIAEFTRTRNKLLEQRETSQPVNAQPNGRMNPDQQAVQANINIFRQRHQWWDPRGVDDDSALVLDLEKQVHNEGYNPGTAAYWQELERRMTDALPHRVATQVRADNTNTQKTQTKTKQRDVPNVGGSSGSNSGAQTKGGDDVFKLSRERRDAMIESGVWDDPKRRNDMIKRYRDYDKKAAGGR